MFYPITKYNYNEKSGFRFIPLFALMFFFTACHDDIYSDITNGGNGVEHNRQPLDSMNLYNIQIDKSTILTNLIRNNNGRYYLDLREQDAEILGIKSELYNNALRNVEQMNNAKRKGVIDKLKRYILILSIK
ncbi:hypothetical protein KZO58_11745 [Prevotella histicola]|jgi:hypothetical protein|uniref:hypothetical protein n=1 Tax=Prevotella histicola TaxID=470565 RepID=UPI001C5DB776|nr:hypothetical protein [Prevotella histicola]MBF1391232.1 hypothetical protein [Prevotella histicola]MBF1426100.1 hypothetical protein [Prevotella histicola]MBW4740153.1 hypothetical protein [Prevotella histicola]MBW4748445.1 hypothetical protein [Prevotella histicola]